MSVYYPQCRGVAQVVFERFSGENHGPIAFPVAPIRARVVRNSYHDADTWEASFDARELPFDPDLVASAQVELAIYDAGPPGEPEVQQRLAAQALQDLAIVGLVDRCELSYDSSEKTVTLAGRDMTALYLDRPWRRQGQRVRRIPGGQRLDTLLKRLMAEAENLPGGEPAVMSLRVEPAELAGSLPVVGGAEGKHTRRGMSPRDADNYWDVMYDLAGRYSFLLFVRGFDVVLTRARTFEESRPKAPRFTWGKNLKHLAISRTMGREVVPQIRVCSYDDSQRKTIEGRFPERGQKVRSGIGTQRDAFQYHYVDGIRSVSVLKRIAESIYYELGRSEREVVIVTDELQDERGGLVLSLHAGDSLEVRFEPFNTEDLHSLSTPQRVQYLVERGYSDEVANVVADEFELINSFRDPFRIRELQIDYDVEEGISVEVMLQDFVRPGGEQPDA